MKTQSKLFTNSTVILGFVTGMICLVPSQVRALSLKFVHDEAIGSPTPIIQSGAALGEQIQNGDFTIERTGINTTLGNGIDEATIWTFDFSDQINSMVKDVVQADIILSLNPQSLISTDSFLILGLPSISFGDLGLGSLPFNQVSDVAINLLDFYDSEQIATTLNDNGFQLDMRYADDSIISGAQASLQVSVPESNGVISFFALALIGSGLGLRRKFVS